MRETSPSLTWEGARGDKQWGNNALVVCWKAGRCQTSQGLQDAVPTEGRGWEEAQCSNGLGQWGKPGRVPEQKLCFLLPEGRLASEARLWDEDGMTGKPGRLTAVTQPPTSREQSSGYDASRLLASPSLLPSAQTQADSGEAEGPQSRKSPILGNVYIVVWLLATPSQGP